MQFLATRLTFFRKFPSTPSNKLWAFGLRAQCRPLLVHVELVRDFRASGVASFFRLLRVFPLRFRLVVAIPLPVEFSLLAVPVAARSSLSGSGGSLRSRPRALRTRRTRQSTCCGGPLGSSRESSGPLLLPLIRRSDSSAASSA
jgi:hypothetical protein